MEHDHKQTKYYIKAPNVFNRKNFEKGTISIFLAGGVTGCFDWRSYIAKKLLSKTNLVIIDPVREDFDIDEQDLVKKQVKWEYEHQRKANCISFWLGNETLCPISLYELGFWSMTNKQLFIGIHPNYARKEEVETRTNLIRPDIKIVYTLEQLTSQIITYMTNNQKGDR